MNFKHRAALFLFALSCFLLWGCGDQPALPAASDSIPSSAALESSSSTVQTQEIFAWQLPREKTYYDFGDEFSGSSDLMPLREDGKLFLGNKEYTKAAMVYSDLYWIIFEDGARIDRTCGKAYWADIPTEVDENRVLEYNDDVMKLSNGIIIEKPFEAYCTAYGHDFQEVLEQEEFHYLLNLPENVLEAYCEHKRIASPEELEMYWEEKSSQPLEETE